MGKRDKHKQQWAEVEEYRDLLQPPDRFEEGFTVRTVIGVLFISLLMTPGELYLGLFTGGGVGAAAQWVTVILFLEVAKRSFTSLKRQEIYLLVYVAGALVVREEGAFLDLLWRQYFVRSAEAEQFGLSHILPTWWAPPPDSEAITERTFFHPDWALPILLLVAGIVMGRIGWFTSGYVLFRLTSDREHLPFPTAPMAALSAMALAEESGDEDETWKWRVFSIGGAIGLGFGALYVGVPTVTEVLFTRRVELIPIPFADLTPYFGTFLPATPLAVAVQLGPIFSGLLMPFWAVIGSFAGVLVHVVASPFLYAYGFLPRWVVGMDTIRTQIVTGIDFWQAFGIGVNLAVTVISFYLLIVTGRRQRQEVRDRVRAGGLESPVCTHDGCNRPSQVRGFCLRHLGRGDFNLWLCIALFSIPTLYTIVMAKVLFPALVSIGLLAIFAFIGFVYAPIISLVSARLDGMVGKDVRIPYVHESVIFLTGFRGVDIWLVPFPGQNFGGNAEQFRIVELTGMRFTSLLKAELLMLPIVFVVSLMYWSFLWRLGPIPSERYPYAQVMWPLKAFNTALYYSGTMYSKMWRPGEVLEDEVLPAGEAVWSPSNLETGRWWYWRAAVTRDVDNPNELDREYRAWSRVGYFYTDFGGQGRPAEPPSEIPAPPPPNQTSTADTRLRGPPPAPPRLLWPADGAVVDTPNPNFRIGFESSPGDSVDFFFQVDLVPSFDSAQHQRSSDQPLLFATLWRDPKFTGNRRDDDGDGRIDEELVNRRDDDGDGIVDEDISHPLDGWKWPIILFGAGFGLLAYCTLSVLGMPIFLIWGYVQSVNGIPYSLLPQIAGALLARYYFWKRYGKQSWRRYAMVLAVGYSVGMSLVGMFCAALLMITKAVSSLAY